MYKELIEFYGPERLEKEMDEFNKEPQIDLRVNTIKTTRDKAAEALLAAGVKTVPTPFSPFGLRMHRGQPLSVSEPWKKGLVYIQDEGSQLVSMLTQVKQGFAVLDYCAGAGGKTLSLAMEMKNIGKLVGTDISEVRLAMANKYG